MSSSKNKVLKSKSTGHKSNADATTLNNKRMSFSLRLLLNILVLGIGALIFSKAIKGNGSYNWLWYTYAPNNLESIKMDKNSEYRDRLAHRLGVDFNYIMLLHDYTPDNAVIFYPSTDDFKATPKFGQKLPFNGRLSDKMTAIRFLYPRKIVIREELGKTPYAKRITHIGIINGRNLDKISYPVDSTLTHSVLPVNPPVQANSQK